MEEDPRCGDVSGESSGGSIVSGLGLGATRLGTRARIRETICCRELELAPPRLSLSLRSRRCAVGERTSSTTSATDRAPCGRCLPGEWEPEPAPQPQPAPQPAPDCA